MYLEEIIIFNYRSCKCINLSLSENNPSIYIGLNDSGKSTILQALDLLLNSKSQYNSLGEGNYKSDLSNTTEKTKKLNELLAEKGLPSFDEDGDSTFIVGKLKYEDAEGDEYAEMNLSTPLKWSIESNEDNVIWLGKKFSNNVNKTYLLMNDSVDSSELWNLTVANINKEIKEATYG